MLILAGTYDQAKQFAKVSNLRCTEWLYVDDAARLMGVKRGSTVHAVGTYYRHPKYLDLLWLIQSRQLVMKKGNTP